MGLSLVVEFPMGTKSYFSGPYRGVVTPASFNFICSTTKLGLRLWDGAGFRDPRVNSGIVKALGSGRIGMREWGVRLYLQP